MKNCAWKEGEMLDDKMGGTPSLLARNPRLPLPSHPHLAVLHATRGLSLSPDRDTVAWVTSRLTDYSAVAYKFIA